MRPANRRAGVAHRLIDHAHSHAIRHAFRRLVLDVVPSRTNAIELYRSRGYTETEPYYSEPPIPMIYMQRPVTPG